MKYSKHIRFQTLLLATLLFGTLSVQACDYVGAHIVNLSQDFLDKAGGNSCFYDDSEAKTRQCVRAGIIEAITDTSCHKRFDIFVPGTTQEHGAWKQFNHMFRKDNDRAHLSLRYEDVRTIDSVLGVGDQADYDRGVVDSATSLVALLDTLIISFGAESIRVFGHSKGAHTLGVVARLPAYQDVEFYAFGQAKRTGQAINDGEVAAAALGTPGNIEKLLPNLVALTWKNDEVRLFRDAGKTPEMWQFPGYIRDESPNKGSAIQMRIDHHNNYGGTYRDGHSSNDWRDGDGNTIGGRNYCATGDRSAFNSGSSGEDECRDGQLVYYAPWFWGNPYCRALAFSMMRTKNPRSYYIGYSGPREKGTCRDSRDFIQVNYEAQYRANIDEKDCKFRITINFIDLYSGEVAHTILLNDTQRGQGNEFKTKSSRTYVPYHMYVHLHAEMIEDSQGFPFPSCDSSRNSDMWIRSLKLTFDHPGTRTKDTVTIIGFREGAGAHLVFKTLDQYNNTAWEQPNKSNEEMRIRWGSIYDAIKIQGDSKEGYEGNFWKRVHLID